MGFQHILGGMLTLALLILLATVIGRWLHGRLDAYQEVRRRAWRWWQDRFEAMRRTAVDLAMAGQDLGLGQAIEEVNRKFVAHLREIDPANRRDESPPKLGVDIGAIPEPPPGCRWPLDLLLHREANGKAKEA
jgi:hypothetical protein